MRRTTITHLAVVALIALTATTATTSAQADVGDFVFPSLSTTAAGGVTADGSSFYGGNGTILILPSSQTCVSGTIDFSEEEAQAIRDQGLDPDRFAAIDESSPVPILTGASFLVNYPALPVSIEEGSTVDIVTSLDPSAGFSAGPLPAGTYNFCLYGIYASVAAYLFDGLETTIGPPAPNPTTTTPTTTAPTTTTTTAPPQQQVTPRYTG